ncbi:MAG: hypothetical protein AAGG07_12265 [Planctomycetota bacterium]
MHRSLVFVCVIVSLLAFCPTVVRAQSHQSDDLALSPTLASSGSAVSGDVEVLESEFRYTVREVATGESLWQIATTRAGLDYEGAVLFELSPSDVGLLALLSDPSGGYYIEVCAGGTGALSRQAIPAAGHTPTGRVLTISDGGICFAVEVVPDDGVGWASLLFQLSELDFIGGVPREHSEVQQMLDAGYAAICAGDVDASEYVDYLDLAEAADALATGVTTTAADINRDGLVDVADLQAVVADLGCRSVWKHSEFTYPIGDAAVTYDDLGGIVFSHAEAEYERQLPDASQVIAVTYIPDTEHLPVPVFHDVPWTLVGTELRFTMLGHGEYVIEYLAPGLDGMERRAAIVDHLAATRQDECVVEWSAEHRGTRSVGISMQFANGKFRPGTLAVVRASAAGVDLIAEGVVTVNAAPIDPASLSASPGGMEYQLLCQPGSLMYFAADPISICGESSSSNSTMELSVASTPALGLITTGDQDADGFWDDLEVLVGSDPTSSVSIPLATVDRDGDGLSDAFECGQFGSNPVLIDSDHDGVTDWDENRMGFLPLAVDSDDDGVLDRDEYVYRLEDSDKDGVGDLFELFFGTDPLLVDSDRDGASDGEEIRFGTSPTDGIIRMPAIGAGTDTDGDGIADSAESRVYGSDPENRDSDGDGLDDGNEVLAGRHVGIAEHSDTDSDSDGLTDLHEQNLGTDPGNNDTDGDQVSDHQELLLGGDPLSEDAYTPSSDGYDVTWSPVQLYATGQGGDAFAEMGIGTQFGSTRSCRWSRPDAASVSFSRANLQQNHIVCGDGALHSSVVAPLSTEIPAGAGQSVRISWNVKGSYRAQVDIYVPPIARNLEVMAIPVSGDVLDAEIFNGCVYQGLLRLSIEKTRSGDDSWVSTQGVVDLVLVPSDGELFDDVLVSREKLVVGVNNEPNTAAFAAGASNVHPRIVPPTQASPADNHPYLSPFVYGPGPFWRSSGQIDGRAAGLRAYHNSIGLRIPGYLARAAGGLELEVAYEGPPPGLEEHIVARDPGSASNTAKMKFPYKFRLWPQDPQDLTPEFYSLREYFANSGYLANGQRVLVSDLPSEYGGDSFNIWFAVEALSPSDSWMGDRVSLSLKLLSREPPGVRYDPRCRSLQEGTEEETNTIWEEAVQSYEIDVTAFEMILRRASAYAIGFEGDPYSAGFAGTRLDLQAVEASARVDAIERVDAISSDGVSAVVLSLIPRPPSHVTTTMHQGGGNVTVPVVFPLTEVVPPLPLTEAEIRAHWDLPRVEGTDFLIVPPSFGRLRYSGESTGGTLRQAPDGYGHNFDFTRTHVSEVNDYGTSVKFDWEEDGHVYSQYAYRSLLTVQPPVVFVHGLWGNSGDSYWPRDVWRMSTPSGILDESTLDDRPRPEANYDLLSVDYADLHSEGFDRTLHRLNEKVMETKWRARRGLLDMRVQGFWPGSCARGLRVDAQRVDVVAHSMGGLLTQLAVSDIEGSFPRLLIGGFAPPGLGGKNYSPQGVSNFTLERLAELPVEYLPGEALDYLRIDNLGAGDFRFVVTLGTPYDGSPLSNAAASNAGASLSKRAKVATLRFGDADDPVQYLGGLNEALVDLGYGSTALIAMRPGNDALKQMAAIPPVRYPPARQMPTVFAFAGELPPGVRSWTMNSVAEQALSLFGSPPVDGVSPPAVLLLRLFFGASDVVVDEIAPGDRTAWNAYRAAAGRFASSMVLADRVLSLSSQRSDGVVTVQSQLAGGAGAYVPSTNGEFGAVVQNHKHSPHTRVSQIGVDGFLSGVHGENASDELSRYVAAMLMHGYINESGVPIYLRPYVGW